MRRLSLLAALLALAGCGDPVSIGHSLATDTSNGRNHVESVCQRASCWDDKSGHFISGDEWNRRQRDR